MNQSELLQFHDECTKRMRAICESKNSDYAGAGADAFSNFSGVEVVGIASTEQGFLTRMFDKLARLASFTKRGQLSVKDESASDTLLDLANYCILLAGYLEARRRAQTSSGG